MIYISQSGNNNFLQIPRRLLAAICNYIDYYTYNHISYMVFRHHHTFSEQKTDHGWLAGWLAGL